MKTKLIVPVNVMRQKQDLLLNASLLSTKTPAGLSVQYTFCPISNHNRQLLLPSLCQFNSVKSTQRGNSIDFCHYYFNYFWVHELNYFLSHRCVYITLRNWIPFFLGLVHPFPFILFSKNCNLRIGLNFLPNAKKKWFAEWDFLTRKTFPYVELKF